MLIFRQKYFQFCTPPLENSTTGITIFSQSENPTNPSKEEKAEGEETGREKELGTCVSL